MTRFARKPTLSFSLLRRPICSSKPLISSLANQSLEEHFSFTLGNTCSPLAITCSLRVNKDKTKREKGNRFNDCKLPVRGAANQDSFWKIFYQQAFFSSKHNRLELILYKYYEMDRYIYRISKNKNVPLSSSNSTASNSISKLVTTSCS